MNHIEIEKEAEVAIKNSDIVVDDQASMEVASEAVLDLKNVRKKIVEFFKDPKKKTDEAHKAVCEQEKKMLNPVDDAIEIRTKAINGYLTEQCRKEDEERRRLEAERRAAEEAERQRLAEEERQKKEEAERLAAEGKTEEAAQVAQEAEAIAVQAEAVYIPPEVPETVVEKTTRTDAGTVSGKEEIQIEIINKKSLIESMLKDGLLEMIDVKEAKLKTWLKLMGKESYPGVGIQKVVNASFRSKKSA